MGDETHHEELPHDFPEQLFGEADEMLVRDKVPDLVEEQGYHAVVKELEGRELSAWLAHRLANEAEEFTREPSIDKMVTMFELLSRIDEVWGVGEVARKHMIEEKQDKLGGFERGLLVLAVAEDDGGV